MKRKIIEIDKQTCDGCGLCIPECPEGAIQIIDDKARLIGDLFCDGLGACIGHCPQGAIRVVEREAEPYDERKVMANIVTQGENTIKAHLHHLRDHGEYEYLKQAVAYLKEKDIRLPITQKSELQVHQHSACPGSQNMSFTSKPAGQPETAEIPSALTHWPIQMHLIAPHAPHFKQSDLVLSADCVAFALAGFHQKYLQGKTLVIACPKLDQNQQIYLEKLKTLINDAKINTLTIMIMQVPCCSGLLRMAQLAVQQSDRKIPIKTVVVGIDGEILREEWVQVEQAAEVV